MKLTALLISAFAALLITGANARAEIRVGVAAPLSGPFALLGKQLVEGSKIAATVLRSSEEISMIVADDKCDAEGGAEAARQFVAANVTIVTGFLCTESLEAALPILQERGLVVLTAGVRAPSLLELRTEPPFPVFRLAPPVKNEGAVTGAILAGIWRDVPFAIVDDGTIYGRELAGSVRSTMEEQGLKPVFTDTYRPGLENQAPLAARLKRAGATHVFVGGERDDVAALSKGARVLGFSLTVAGGEALSAASGPNELAPGTLMVAAPEPQTLESAATAKAAIEATGLASEGYAIPGFAAMEVAIQAVEANRTESASITEILRRKSFATALGELQFDQSGHRKDNPYRLFRYNGSQFVMERQ
ncbi:MAG: branched-chain amino acid ABC transporter substrate-binding protein [Phyllobacterium sp.]